MRKFLAAAALLLATALPAWAQSGCPSIVTGAVLTAGQWQACFQAKNDTLGFIPLNRAGGVMTGPLLSFASSLTNAGLRIPPGTAPTSPFDGDTWTTTAGMFIRINGVTIGPLGGASASSFSATAPLAVTFPAGVTNYALNFDANFVLSGSNLAFASIASGSVLANSTVGSAEPTATPLSTLIDRAFTATAQGTILYRGASSWTALAPGTLNQALHTGGAGGNPAWSTATYPSTTTINQVLYSSSANVVTGLATANNGALITNGSGVPSIGAVPNANLATTTAFSFKGNATGSTATPTDFTPSSLTNKASPISGDLIVIADSAASFAFKNATIGSIASAGSVASLNGLTGSLTIPIAPGGRVTSTTGTAYPSSDVTGASTIFYTQVDSLQASIYDGSNFVPRTLSGQLTYTLTAGNNPANTAYDLYLAFDTGAVVLCSSPAWTNSAAGTSSRGSGAATAQITNTVGGRWTNAVSMACKNNASTYTVAANQGLLVGGFHTNGTNGQYNDSKASRLAWDLYRPNDRVVLAANTASSYAYVTGSLRQCNAASAGGGTPVQLEWHNGMVGLAARIRNKIEASSSNGGTITVGVGIGINSTSAQSAQIFEDNGVSATLNLAGVYLNADWSDTPALGYNVAYCQELGGTSVTMYGTNGTATKQTGMIGTVNQ